MELQPITNSSAVVGVAYVPADQKLLVKFKQNGITYEFFKVPKKVYDEFLEADSMGTYYHKRIKGKFPHSP